MNKLLGPTKTYFLLVIKTFKLLTNHKIGIYKFSIEWNHYCHNSEFTEQETATFQLAPNFFIEYLTQNVIFQVKSHVAKHEF